MSPDDLGAHRSSHAGRPSQLHGLGIAFLVLGALLLVLVLVNGSRPLTRMATPTLLVGGALLVFLSRRHGRQRVELLERGFRYSDVDGAVLSARYTDVTRLTLTDRSADGRVPPKLHIDLRDGRSVVLREDTLKDLPVIAEELRREVSCAPAA